MTKLPFMRFWGADYMKDTQHLTFEEHGVYFHLLWFMWEQGGQLPDDDRIIAIRLGVTPRKWQGYKRRLRQFFDYYGPPTERQFSQKRLVIELNSAIERTRVNAMNGAKGGRIKAKNTKEYQQALSSERSSERSSDRASEKPSEILAKNLAAHKGRNISSSSLLTAAREEETTPETQPSPDGARATDGPAPPAVREKPSLHYLLDTSVMRRAMLQEPTDPDT